MTLPVLSMDEIVKQAQEAQWLIEGFLSINSFAAIFGFWKSFKSFLALDWALCVAYGIPWQGHEVRRGRVVYVYGEGGLGALRNRIEAWMLQNGQSEYSQNFWAIPKPVPVTDKNEVQMMIKAIEAQVRGAAPALVVVDTLARNFAGNENATEDMNAFIQGCDRIKEAFGGATVLVVHHTGHMASERARGSSALPGALDTQFQVSREAKAMCFELETKFQKDAEDYETLRLNMTKHPLEGGRSSLAVGEASLPNSVREKMAGVLASAGPDGLAKGEWQERARVGAGVNASSFRGELARSRGEWGERNGRFVFAKYLQQPENLS